MKRGLSTILAILTAAAPALAADNGGRPGAFLDYAASARSLGMGQAFTAVADDPSAIYWNPSGISTMGQKSVAAQYSTLLEDSSYGFIGYTNPLENGGFGVGFVNLQSGQITRRDDLGHKTGSYDAVSNAALLSGSFAPSSTFSLGSTFKLVREAVDGKSGSGFGLDASALMRATEQLRFGLMLRNVAAPSVKLDSTADKYPRSVSVGAGYKPVQPLTLSIDLEKPQGDSLRPRLGAEYLINNTLALRAGVNDAEFAAGLGIGFGGWNFDYAMGLSRASSEIRDLGSFQRFGLRFNFGAAPEHVASAPISRPVFVAPARHAAPAPAAAAAPAATHAPRGMKTPEQLALYSLGRKMDTWDGVPTPEIQKQVNTVSKNLKHGKYQRSEDLYAAEGYVSYFTGEYSRSVRSLEQAKAAAPNDKAMASRLEKAKAAETKAALRSRPDRSAGATTAEMKAIRDRYDNGDWTGTILLAQHALEASPQNTEAAGYLRRSIDHLKQPYMKQAKDDVDADRFVESFVIFQKILDYDPDDAEAKAYSERVVRVIEKKSDLDASMRGVNKSDPEINEGVSLYEKGLRLFAHGNTAGAKEAWDAALPHLKGKPALYDSVRTAIVDLGSAR
ncbi:MAG: PorV/PorQ family protein [Elusimicrobia bacterium]|nr:PorV/PorQ family protein [Elusimicrobiota bacterium]